MGFVVPVSMRGVRVNVHGTVFDAMRRLNAVFDEYCREGYEVVSVSVKPISRFDLGYADWIIEMDFEGSLK